MRKPAAPMSIIFSFLLLLSLNAFLGPVAMDDPRPGAWYPPHRPSARRATARPSPVGAALDQAEEGAPAGRAPREVPVRHRVISSIVHKCECRPAVRRTFTSASRPST